MRGRMGVVERESIECALGSGVGRLMVGVRGVVKEERCRAFVP